MTRWRILPYRQGSAGAKALAVALGGKVLKLVGSKFVPRQYDRIINWGNVNQGITDWLILNRGEYIRQASNKLLFFQRMVETGNAEIIPEFWTDKTEIPDDVFPIFCRTKLAGHSGDGIVVADTRDNLVNAPLYVRYVKKQEEYRVHVGRKNGEVVLISVQRKARRLECPNPNWQVRNHANGFVFVREGVSPPSAVCEVANKALSATLLDFGAVDVIYNQKKGRAYVLEINTAPGLEGQTVTDYATFFKSL